MRLIIIFTLFGQFLLYSCNPKKTENKNGGDNEIKESAIIEIEDNNTTPTVDLATYKLIVDSAKDRKRDAEQVLKVKRKWPLAMQSKSPAAFDSILSKDFFFGGGNSLLNRSDYIKDRTKSGDWIITFVKYENLILQFIGDRGILTYVNHVTNKNQKTGDTEIEHMTWVDIYVLENGEWKIGAAFPIDYRVEVPIK